MKWMRYAARILVILWAAFWIFFAVGSALGGGDGREVSKTEQLKGILSVAGIIVMALGGAYLAFRRELVSGICLSIIGLFIAIWQLREYRVHHPAGFLPTLLMMGGPPLVAGGLFLLSYWKTKKAG
jgi:hypothetical protein